MTPVGRRAGGGRRCRLVPALLLVALVGLLAACAPATDPSGGGQPKGDPAASPGEARVDVDTPALRRAKQRAGIAPCEPGDGEPVEGGLPEVTLPCLGGGPDVELARLRGPMVINVWASWCGPCREELPVLQRFYDRHSAQVGMLGIDYSDPRVSAAMELAVDSGVRYPLLADPGQEISGEAPFPRMQGLPFLALVDEQGRVVHREFTVIRDVATLEELVDTHLGVPL